MRRPGRRIQSFFLLYASLAGTLALATSFYELPFEKALSGAPIVVRGTIGNSYSDWSKGEAVSRIYTYYQLELEEVFKGNPEGTTLLMRELGGEKDGTGLQVAGAAHFEPGEDVVVLLSDRTPEGTYELRGLSTGKFVLEKRSDGQEYLIGMGVGATVSGMIVHGDGPGEGGARAADSTWPLRRVRQNIADAHQTPRVTHPQQQQAAAPSPQPSPFPRPSGRTEAIPSPVPSVAQEGPAPGRTSVGWGWVGLGILALAVAIGILTRL